MSNELDITDNYRSKVDAAIGLSTKSHPDEETKALAEDEYIRQNEGNQDHDEHLQNQNQDSKIYLHKSSYKTTSKFSSKLIDNLEREYYELNSEFESIINKQQNSENGNNNKSDPILRENKQLGGIIDKMNDIVTVLVDNLDSLNTKNTNTISKKYKVKGGHNTSVINPDDVNIDKEGKKLLEIFKNEYFQLEQKFNKISSPEFFNQLQLTLKEYNNQIGDTEKRIKEKKLIEKKNNANLTRKVNLVKKVEDNENHNSMLRVKTDLDSLISQNKTLEDKIEDQKKALDEEMKKLVLEESYLAKIDKSAKSAGVEDFDHINIEKRKERKDFLLKKLKVLESQNNSNKRKYEMEINKKKKQISHLKEEIRLNKELSEKEYVSLQNTINKINKRSSGDMLPQVEKLISEVMTSKEKEKPVFQVQENTAHKERIKLKPIKKEKESLKDSNISQNVDPLAIEEKIEEDITKEIPKNDSPLMKQEDIENKQEKEVINSHNIIEKDTKYEETHKKSNLFSGNNPLLNANNMISQPANDPIKVFTNNTNENISKEANDFNSLPKIGVNNNIEEIKQQRKREKRRSDRALEEVDEVVV